MNKPNYDYQLVLALQKKCNGSNVHTINTLLSQYENLFVIAEDAGEETHLNGKAFNIYAHIVEIHGLMENALKDVDSRKYYAKLYS
jgi:hypothetical protein